MPPLRNSLHKCVHLWGPRRAEERELAQYVFIIGGDTARRARPDRRHFPLSGAGFPRYHRFPQSRQKRRPHVHPARRASSLIRPREKTPPLPTGLGPASSTMTSSEPQLGHRYGPVAGFSRPAGSSHQSPSDSRPSSASRDGATVGMSVYLFLLSRALEMR